MYGGWAELEKEKIFRKQSHKSNSSVSSNQEIWKCDTSKNCEIVASFTEVEPFCMNNKIVDIIHFQANHISPR